jgi:hypothetical protein
VDISSFLSSILYFLVVGLENIFVISIIINNLIPFSPPALALLFTNRTLQRYEGLIKTQSTLLSQARIGDISLWDYPFRVKVLEVNTPY